MPQHLLVLVNPKTHELIYYAGRLAWLGYFVTLFAIAHSPLLAGRARAMALSRQRVHT